MYYLQTILFYVISCSTIFVYGIGLDSTFLATREIPKNKKLIATTSIEIVLSIVLLWFIFSHFLIAYNLIFLIPMTVIMVCILIHLIVDIFISLPAAHIMRDRFFTIGLVYLSLSEANSLITALIIALFSLIAFYCTNIILYAIKKRESEARIPADWKGAPLLLISMGILCIALYSMDVSWWLQGGFL